MSWMHFQQQDKQANGKRREVSPRVVTAGGTHTSIPVEEGCSRAEGSEPQISMERLPKSNHPESVGPGVSLVVMSEVETGAGHSPSSPCTRWCSRSGPSRDAPDASRSEDRSVAWAWARCQGRGGAAPLIQDTEGATEKPLPSACLRPRARCESPPWSLSSPPPSPPRRHLERSVSTFALNSQTPGAGGSWAEQAPPRCGPAPPGWRGRGPLSTPLPVTSHRCQRHRGVVPIDVCCSFLVFLLKRCWKIPQRVRGGGGEGSYLWPVVEI